MVADGLAEIGALLKEYHKLTVNYEKTKVDQLEKIQSQLEARDGWSISQKVDSVITQLELLQISSCLNFLEDGAKELLLLVH